MISSTLFNKKSFDMLVDCMDYEIAFVNGLFSKWWFVAKMLSGEQKEDQEGSNLMLEYST